MDAGRRVGRREEARERRRRDARGARMGVEGDFDEETARLSARVAAAERRDALGGGGRVVPRGLMQLNFVKKPEM